jgi:hypothetical protein
MATPYPGTELFEYAEKKDLLLTKDWSFYTAVKPVINPKYYSVEELNRFFTLAYRSFYTSPGVLVHHLGKGRIGFFTKIIKSLIPKFFLLGDRNSKLKPRKTFDVSKDY